MWYFLIILTYYFYCADTFSNEPTARRLLFVTILQLKSTHTVHTFKNETKHVELLKARVIVFMLLHVQEVCKKYETYANCAGFIFCVFRVTEYICYLER